MRVDASAAAGFTVAPFSLLLAEADAATVYTPAPQSLVLTNAAADTVYSPAPLPLVLAQLLGLIVLLGWMEHWSYKLIR